jgi:hypothetical protein
MTDPQIAEIAADDCNPDRIMRELSDLQQWCVLMSRKDRGGMPAADLIQRTRICIVNLRQSVAAYLKEQSDA